MNSEETFGYLAMNICGDFLQLPPVEKKKGARRSLAVPLDAEDVVRSMMKMPIITPRKIALKRDNPWRHGKVLSSGAPSLVWCV